MDLHYNHTDSDVIESWFADLTDGPELSKSVVAPTSHNKSKHIVNPDESDILRFRLEAQKKRKAIQEDIAKSVGKKLNEDSDEEGGRFSAILNNSKRRKLDLSIKSTGIEPETKKKKKKKSKATSDE